MIIGPFYWILKTKPFHGCSKRCIMNIHKGTLGVEPRTCRTAAGCSTTELYPLHVKYLDQKNYFFSPKEALNNKDEIKEEKIQKSYISFTVEQLKTLLRHLKTCSSFELENSRETCSVDYCNAMLLRFFCVETLATRHQVTKRIFFMPCNTYYYISHTIVQSLWNFIVAGEIQQI